MTDASHGGAAKAQQEKSLAYKDMSPSQKLRYILKLATCILTFGFVYPNIMND